MNFTCARCRRGHLALPPIQPTGAWIIPPTLTSKRDTDGEWCLICTEPCEARPRADRLKVNRPFYVILTYDIEGFHSALTSRTTADVKAQAERRSSNRQMGIIACTPVFEGFWAPGVFDRQGFIADVSAPAEWQEFLAVLEKPPKEES